MSKRATSCIFACVGLGLLGLPAMGLRAETAGAQPPRYIMETLAGNGAPGTPADLAPATESPLMGPTTAGVDDFLTVYVADVDGVRIVRDGKIWTQPATTGLGRVHDLSVAPAFYRYLDRGVIERVGPTIFISTDEHLLWLLGHPGGPGGVDIFPTESLRGFVATLLPVDVFVATGAGGQIFLANSQGPLYPDVHLAGRPGRTGNKAETCFLNERGGAPSACLRTAGRIAMDYRLEYPDHELYLCDSGNHSIRKVTWRGIITTVAGGAAAGLTDEEARGFSGDGGPARQARLSEPQGVALDREGNVYVSDSGNRRVRRISADGTIWTIAGNGEEGDTGDGGPALEASFCSPAGLGVADDGTVYVADTCNYKVRLLRPVLESNASAGSARAAKGE